MKKVIIILALFVSGTAAFGQDDFLKQQIIEALKLDNCDKAQVLYDSYKRIDNNLLERINACRERRAVEERRIIMEALQKSLDFAMNSNPKSSYGNGKYKGQKSFGRRSGSGAYYWDSSDTKDFYFGGFSKGNREGAGIYIIGNLDDGRYISNCPDCKFYSGGWANGKKSGQGTCYDKTGKMIYYGDFIDDKPAKTYPSTDSNASYKFQIKYEDKNLYVGETDAGKRHGAGIYLWQNGDMWYGEWADDTRAGTGIHIYKDGTVKTGVWESNKYNPSGTAKL